MPTRRKTVGRKLTELILGTCMGVLAVALLGLTAFEVHSYRQSAAASLSTMAEIVAENSAAAILFEDERLAEEILAALRFESEIAAAALFDAGGRVVATYPRKGPGALVPPEIEPDGVTLGLRELSVWKPVRQGDKRVGTIYFKGSLRGTYQRLKAYASVIAMIAIAAAGVTLGLSHYLQRRISRPLGSLAASAQRIRTEGDYSVRATKESDDEFGDLTDAFNTMLDRIHASSLQLQEHEERFRTLADNMVQLAWMADAKGEFQWYNKRWHDYTGLNLQESKEKGWLKVHPDFRERLRTELGACFARGEEWVDTFPLEGADGKYRWFLSNAVPIRNAAGQVTRWFGTNTDVTELRDVQQDLRRARDEALAASQAKDDFLAKLSHELRTPLNPVLLIVSDEERNQQLPAEVRGDFETIKKNIELEARLIDDLLDLTAIVRGKLVLQRRVVTLNSIVADALGKVEADAANRMVTLKVRFDQSNPMIDGDAVRIQQALWNVIRNAVKFSPDGGVVTISTQASPASGMVGVTITDGGIGMSREELTRIFEPFAQGDHAAGRGSHRFGGLGLGLAIARRVVELHSGRIFATSVGRNQGSTFLIELPLAAPAALPLNASTGGEAKIHAIAAGMGLRVLLVEDHEPTRTALERLLSRRGFRVLSAAAAGEARQVLLNQPPDLLISDIGLPDGSGYTLMEQFRARPGAVGIALTGYGMEADVTRATDAGFMVHITKPVRVDALDKALGSALAALKPS